LPSSFYDSLVYHLGIPNFYLQNQGFIPTPHFFFANTSIYYEISLIPAVFAGDMVPQLFHFLLGMVFLLSISDLAFRFFRLEKRFILLIILLSMPITVFLLCTVKNDLLSAFFIVLGIKYYLENKFKRSALCWGFAIGIKYFNILPLGIFLLLVFIKQKKFNFKRLIIFGIIITTILLPLFIKNYIFTQNPVFPFLGGIFPSVNPYFDASRFAVMKTDVGRLIHTWQDLLKLPYTLSFYELGSGGLIGVQFLIFLPFLIIIRKKAGNSFLFVFALLFLAVGSCFTSQVRFMYAACTILAIFTAFIYQSLSQAGPKIMKILFFIIIGLNLVASFGYHERIYRAYYLYSGKSSDIDQYIQEVFPSYPAFNFVNKNLPENARILLVGEARNYYLKRPYYASSGIDYAMIKKYLSPGTTFAEFKAALKKDKITHIIFNAGEFQRLKREYRCLDDYEETLLIAFFKQLQPIFINPNGNLYVYETI
jgi:predicted nucleic acid-binding Zn finger protein